MGMADHHGRHATFRRILAAIDGSSISRHALREAVLLAKDQHACLRIVQVVDLAPLYEAEASGIDVSVAEQALLREAESELAKAADVARHAGVASETALLPIYGSGIGEAIVADARGWPADLIALGTHGRHGIQRMILGSVADSVARSSPVPVLLVRGEARVGN